MTDWTTFAGFAGVVLALVLLLSHASKDVIRSAEDGPGSAGADDFDPDVDWAAAAERLASSDGSPAEGTERTGDAAGTGDAARTEDLAGTEGASATTAPVEADAVEADAAEAGAVDGIVTDAETEPTGGPRRATGLARERPSSSRPELTTGELLANVAVTHGLFGALLLVGAWYAEVPPGALGVEATPASTGLPALGVGVGLGVALYAANEVGATVGERFGVGHSETLRAALAPDTLAGWVVLLGAVLPVVAAFEELLFRAALVGALQAGFGVSPWLLAVGSSVAFAVGHGAQGAGGMAVTGVLGFALAAAFVLTGSLLAVIVAHYVVNALEFLIHEGLDVEWAKRS